MTKKTTRSAYIKGIEHLNADSHVAADAKPHASKAPSYYFLLLKDVCSGLIIPDTILGGTVATMT